MKALIFAESKNISNPSEKLNSLSRNLKINNILVEYIDINSQRGSDVATTYDVMSFPALVLLREDGVVQDIWQGELPDYGLISHSVGHI